MTIDSDKLFARLDELGVDAVEERLARGAFGIKKVPIVELWLSGQKSKPASGAQSDAADTSVEPNKIYQWLKPHAWVIGIILALLAVIAGFAGPIPSWFSNATEQITETYPRQDETADSLRAIEVQENLKIQGLYEVTRSRLHDSQSFLFADYQYEDTGSGHRYGSVDVYAANQNTYTKVDHQSCSYPDGSKIQTDAEQRILLVSCSFADWYRDRSDSDEEDYSYTVTVVRFFDSDRELSVSLSCECIGVTISSADLNVSEKELNLTFFTTGTSVRVSGLDENPITLPPVENDRSSGPARVVKLEFDQFWKLRSFDLVE